VGGAIFPKPQLQSFAVSVNISFFPSLSMSPIKGEKDGKDCNQWFWQNWTDCF